MDKPSFFLRSRSAAAHGHRTIWDKVTEAITRGKVACKYYNTRVSAYIVNWDSDRLPLRKNSDFNWSRNFTWDNDTVSGFFPANPNFKQVKCQLPYKIRYFFGKH